MLNLLAFCLIFKGFSRCEDVKSSSRGSATLLDPSSVMSFRTAIDKTFQSMEPHLEDFTGAVSNETVVSNNETFYATKPLDIKRQDNFRSEISSSKKAVVTSPLVLSTSSVLLPSESINGDEASLYARKEINIFSRSPSMPTSAENFPLRINQTSDELKHQPRSLTEPETKHSKIDQTQTTLMDDKKTKTVAFNELSKLKENIYTTSNFSERTGQTTKTANLFETPWIIPSRTLKIDELFYPNVLQTIRTSDFAKKKGFFDSTVISSLFYPVTSESILATPNYFSAYNSSSSTLSETISSSTKNSNNTKAFSYPDDIFTYLINDLSFLLGKKNSSLFESPLLENYSDESFIRKDETEFMNQKLTYEHKTNDFISSWINKDMLSPTSSFPSYELSDLTEPDHEYEMESLITRQGESIKSFSLDISLLQTPTVTLSPNWTRHNFIPLYLNLSTTKVHEISPTKSVRLNGTSYAFILRQNCSDDEIADQIRNAINTVPLSDKLKNISSTKYLQCDAYYILKIPEKDIPEDSIKEILKHIKSEFKGFEILDIFKMQSNSTQNDESLDDYDVLYNRGINLSFKTVYIIAVVIAGAIVSLLLLVVGLCIKMSCKKKATLLDLSDIPHLTLNVENYKLSPIPRPSISLSNTNKEFFHAYSNEIYSRSRGDDDMLSQQQFYNSSSKMYDEVGGNETNSLAHEMHSFSDGIYDQNSVAGISRRVSVNQQSKQIGNRDTKQARKKDGYSLRKLDVNNLSFRKV